LLNFEAKRLDFSKFLLGEVLLLGLDPPPCCLKTRPDILSIEVEKTFVLLG
jgi:hypothetical protein